MADIHPTAIVDPGAELGDAVSIGPYCTVGPHVRLGARVQLISHVVVDGHTRLDADCTVYPFASLGYAPQHLAHKDEPTTLSIGAGTTIREHVTMNIGTAMGRGETVVGANGLFMAGSHVAHDSIVGDNVIFANHATIGGHVQVGDGVFLGGLCAVHQYARIGRYAFVGGMAGLEGDLIPYGSVMGNRAHLAGLNLVGMKRRNMERSRIHALRGAFRQLFLEQSDETFETRLRTVAKIYKDNAEVMEIIRFVEADARRPLCLPRERRAA